MGNSESTNAVEKREREESSGSDKKEAKRRKGDAWGDGNVHDYVEEGDWSGNFVVLGTTGSGKTTLIRSSLSLTVSMSLCRIL